MLLDGSPPRAICCSSQVGCRIASPPQVMVEIVCELRSGSVSQSNLDLAILEPRLEPRLRRRRGDSDDRAVEPKGTAVARTDNRIDYRLPREASSSDAYTDRAAPSTSPGPFHSRALLRL